MPQHDYDIADQTGANFRADLNNLLAAILGNNDGATAPSTTAPYMWWMDSSAGILKQRNAADTAWISKFNIGDSFTNLDNTSDSAKPVSTAQQTALNLKANLASPILTGTPLAPTPTGGDDSTKIATTEFVQAAQIAGLPKTIAGMALTSTSTNFTVAAGSCIADDGETTIKLTSAITKVNNQAWVVGNSNGGLYTSSPHTNKVYHLFVIMKDSDGSVDAFSDDNISCTNIPSGYTRYRRVGTRSGASSITLSQNLFLNYDMDIIEVAGGALLHTHKATENDLDTAASGTTDQSLNMTIPAGVPMQCNYGARANDSVATYLRIRGNNTTDEAADNTTLTIQSDVGSDKNNIEGSVITDPSGANYGSINYRSSANFTNLRIKTLSYIDFRRD